MRRSTVLVPLALSALGLAWSVAPAADASGSAPPTAKAGLGLWKQVSTHSVDARSQVDLLPLPSGGMQAVWWEADGATKASIRAGVVNESGTFGSPVAAVVSGWTSTVFDPQIINWDHKRLVVFAGQRAATPNPLNGIMLGASSTDGTTWTLESGSLAQDDAMDSSYGTAAIDDAGTPLIGVNAGSGGDVLYHSGFDPTRPATSADFYSSSTVCCADQVAMAKDTSTGDVFASWYTSSNGNPANNGIVAESVPAGGLLHAPKSAKAALSNDPLQDVAMAARTGGDVYVAYQVGYPTTKQVAVWKVGGGAPVLLPAKDATRVTLAAGAHGRLWVAWYDAAKNQLHAARSNPAATRFGRVQTVALPSNKPGTTVNTMMASGPKGPLFLFVNGQVGTAKPQIYYRKVNPSLTLVVTPRTLNHGIVTAKVTDAGAAVSGARVKVGTTTKPTNAAGIARFRIGVHFPAGKITFKATKAGYAAGTAQVKVT